ncbi:MAG: ribosomal protein L13e [Candidatus Heimdallarchaeota archaeon]|nr:ribosomal protein L13e [Candidatus Heimdallarchaeota archaeon]MCK5298113.1 ribosomal protein L13e [Candidatus Heimdallarchaeota archaeon]
MMKPSVSVESPATNNPRKGRGFSKDELAAIKWNVKQAREAGLIVDERRKSKYKENIATLKVFKEDYVKVLADREKALLKARKDGVKARREAKKRKQIEDKESIEREKEIEEERKRIQEEISKREAEELEVESEAEELTEDELAELDTLEEGIDSEETPEEALEKVEEELAEAIGITKEEKKPEVAAPEGTKKTVKRVRKKPTATTKGAVDEAEKKE